MRPAAAAERCSPIGSRGSAPAPRPGARNYARRGAPRSLSSRALTTVSTLDPATSMRGEVDAEVPPMVAAGNIFSLYFGALMTWLSGFATLEAALEPGLRDALSLQIRGLSPR